MTNTWKADKSHIGRTVVCVDNHSYLTYGNEYKIAGVCVSGIYVSIIDDSGHGRSYHNHHFKLKKEEQPVKTTTNLPDNFKIRIKNSEHSALVQKWLFENGYKWSDGSERTQNTNTKFLYCRGDGSIRFGGDESSFIEKPFQEVVFNVTVVPRVVEEEQAPQEVEIFGKKYVVKDKELLENALKSAGIIEKE